MLFTTAALPAGADGQSAGSNDLAGCYRLDVNPWRPATASSAVREAGYAPPAFMELMARRGVGVVDHGHRLVRPLLADPDPHHAAYWHVRPPDSVYVVWSNGFSGLRLELRPDGRGLSGTARAFSDAPDGVRASAPVIAGRISCAVARVGRAP